MSDLKCGFLDEKLKRCDAEKVKHNPHLVVNLCETHHDQLRDYETNVIQQARLAFIKNKEATKKRTIYFKEFNRLEQEYPGSIN